jgi:hypothetical protein
VYKKYVVRLSDEERQVCQDVVKKPNGSSQKVRWAQILLKADADGSNWIDARIADAFHCRVQTIENLRKRLVTEGFEAALYSGPQMVDHSGHVHLLRLLPFLAPPNLAPIDFSRGLIIKRLMGTLLIVELEVGRQA